MCVCAYRLTGVEAIEKIMQAWASGPLYPDIPPALSKINNAGIKVPTRAAIAHCALLLVLTDLRLLNTA